MTGAQPCKAEAQVLFDTALSGVRAQGCYSAVKGWGGATCNYRGPNGIKCAVGHVLADGDYKPSFEGKTINILAKLLPDRLLPYLDLLKAMQDAHDGCADDELPMSDFEQRMKQVAERFGLRYLPMSEVVALSDDPKLLARASDLREV